MARKRFKDIHKEFETRTDECDERNKEEVQEGKAAIIRIGQMR